MFSLSGGNQQRVVMARELSHDPRVLVAAQPTRGLDVGAIEYLSEQIRAAARSGVGVLLISTELDEVLDLAHRILVIVNGRIVGRDAQRRRRHGAARDVDDRGPRRVGRRAHPRVEALMVPTAMSDLGTTAATIDEERPEVVAQARQRSRRGISLEVIGLYAICIAGALVLAALLVAATGGSWTAVFSAILDGSVLNRGRIGLTLAVSAPILLVALGTIVSGRAGLVNIGQEGQLVMGSCFAAFAASRLAGPGPFVLITSMLVGIVGGAIWAGIAGVLRYWRNVPEVLTTLLLGSVAANLMGLALRHQSLLLAPASGRANRNQVSEPLPEDTRIPRVTWFGNEFPISVFLAIGLAIVLSIVLSRTVVGFRLRMLGRNPGTAMRAGVAERRYGLGAMLVSGGFAGLAGGHHARRRRLRELPAGRQLRRRHRLRRPARGARRPPTCARRDLRRVHLRRPAHRLRLPARHRRVGPHRRRRAGPARAVAAAATRRPLHPRAPPRARRHHRPHMMMRSAS